MFEGFVSPFAETERRTQYTNQAWDAVRSDPASAALIAGLSMLSGNNGEKSLGQLVGRAGLDTLAGMQRLDAQKRAQTRFAERRTGNGGTSQNEWFGPSVPSTAEVSGTLVAVQEEPDTSLPQQGAASAASARRRRLVRPRMSGRRS